MLVKNINETIIETGKLSLENFKKDNLGVMPRGFLEIIESRKYNKNGGFYYFTSKKSFQSYCKLNYDASCLATCLEMMCGNNERYWNVYKSLGLENNPIKLINIIADQIVIHQYKNAFPLYNLKDLEDFRVRILQQQRDEYKVLYNPDEREISEFEKNWLNEEKIIIEHVFTVENSNNTENSRVERTAFLVVLGNYEKMIEKEIEKFRGENSESLLGNQKKITLKDIFSNETYFKVCLSLFVDCDVVDANNELLITAGNGTSLYGLIDTIKTHSKKFLIRSYKDEELLALFNNHLGTNYQQLKRNGKGYNFALPNR